VPERRPPRRTASLLAVLLVAAGLTGCSHGTSSYCSTLKHERNHLTNLAKRSAKPGRAGAAALGDTVGVLSDLRDRAPGDIADEWETLVTALRGLDDAVRETGAAPSDFAGGRRPPGVSIGQFQAVQRAAAELRSTRVRQAGTSIEQHAQGVCKVDLGSGLGGVG
jgi:hypothetical protein